MRKLVYTPLLFVCQLWAQDAFFLQGSDPQFGMYAADRSFAQETANFEFFIATANRLKPTFVILCGDLINQAGNRLQADEFLRVAGKLDKSISLHYVAGNHDVKNEPTGESIAAYVQRFGKDYYSFRHGSVYGIVLNSTLIHTPRNAQAAYDAQEQWLRAELAKARTAGARHIVIFQHHPWFLERADEPDQYFNIPLERRRTYLALFREYGVEYLFSGHYHRNAVAQEGSLHMITTGPIGMPLGPDGSGFRIVSVLPEELRQEWIGFGNIPSEWPRKAKK
jgi:3',5'-cyclic AMP phosphodiesterase CpdA